MLPPSISRAFPFPLLVLLHMLPVLSSPAPAFGLLLSRDARPYLEIRSVGGFEDEDALLPPPVPPAPAALARGVLLPLPPLALALRLPIAGA